MTTPSKLKLNLNLNIKMNHFILIPETEPVATSEPQSKNEPSPPQSDMEDDDNLMPHNNLDGVKIKM